MLSARPSLLAAVLGAGLAFLVAPAVALAGGYSVQALRFDVNVGPAHSLSCSIDANLYRPDGVSAAHRAPAVLMTNPYLGTKASEDTLAGDFASDGYVVLSYSGLGWGASTCPIELDIPAYDGEAASQLITFLGGGSVATDGTRVDYVKLDRVAHNGHRYAHDPRVGMIGVSYGAEATFSAASEDPRLDTIIPIATWDDLSYSLAPNDAGLHGWSVSSTVPGTEKTEWAEELLAGGGIVGTATGGANGNTSALSGCGDFNPGVCPMAVDLETNGYLDPTETAFLRGASVESYIHDIRVPTMLVQGEDDTLFTLKEEIATYALLHRQHVPVRLVWQSWGHSDETPRLGELGVDSSGNIGLDNPNGTLTVEGRLILDWMNHYLKDRGPAPALNFSFYEPWVTYPGTSAGAAYASAPAYPVGRDQRLYLSGTDELTAAPADVAGGRASFTTSAPGAPTSVTEISGASQSVPLFDPPGTYAEWESAPLTSSERIVGSPTVRLRVSAPLETDDAGGDLVLFAKLEDIAPNGSATLPDRLIAPARFRATGGYVTIDLPAIAHEFPRGDRVALIVAGSDSAYRGDLYPTPVAITTSSSAPGTLTLPVLGRRSAGPLVYVSRTKPRRRRHRRHRR